MDSYFGRRYNHGTPFRRAVEEGLIDPGHSIQVGIRGSVYSKGDLNASKELGLEMVTAIEIQQIGIPAIIQKIHERVKTAKAFVTFDIDFVDAAYAPGQEPLKWADLRAWKRCRQSKATKGIESDRI